MSVSPPPKPASARSVKPNGLTFMRAPSRSIGTSPRVGKFAQFLCQQPEIRMASAVGVASAPLTSSPVRPKRPLSASRVSSSPTSTPSTNTVAHSFKARVRPASASQTRPISPDKSANDIDTHSNSVSYLSPQYQGIFTVVDDQEEEIEPMTPKSNSTARMTALPASTDPVVAHAKFQAFLDMWEEEQPHFRSSVLFSETTFTQAKGKCYNNYPSTRMVNTNATSPN